MTCFGKRPAAIALISLGLLAGCYPAHSTYRAGYEPTARAYDPGRAVYRTDDGRVFPTAAARDAYLRHRDRVEAEAVRERRIRARERRRLEAEYRRAEEEAEARRRAREDRQARRLAREEAEARRRAREEAEYRREARLRRLELEADRLDREREARRRARTERRRAAEADRTARQTLERAREYNAIYPGFDHIGPNGLPYCEFANGRLAPCGSQPGRTADQSK